MISTLIKFIKREEENFPWGISLILVLFVILGTTYSVVTPIFEASDELWHYLFIKHLADGNGLPMQDASANQPWRQEGGQPPLY
jgi:hypothetical protein